MRSQPLMGQLTHEDGLWDAPCGPDGWFIDGSIDNLMSTIARRDKPPPSCNLSGACNCIEMASFQ